MITFKHKGDFDSTTKFLESANGKEIFKKLSLYGQKGVDALSKATPVDTGLTAASWYFKIVETRKSVSIQWCNSNKNKGVPIAIVIQYGHAMPNGGYVKGIDYINPALKPIFDEISRNVWKEVVGDEQRNR